jgi:hypothetical protein
MTVLSLEQTFFDQGLRRASLNAGAATDAIGLEKWLVLPGDDAGLEAAAVDG